MRGVFILGDAKDAGQVVTFSRAVVISSRTWCHRKLRIDVFTVARLQKLALTRQSARAVHANYDVACVCGVVATGLPS